MPDIREILAALKPDDRAVYMETRNNMRANYLHAHNLAVGINSWDQSDDSFFDLIDIKLALLFDRGGKLDTVKEIIGNEDKQIEQDVHTAEDQMKAKAKVETPVIEKSPASVALASSDWGMPQ